MLTISNLQKAYGKRQVLTNLNMEIKTGEIYGLLGPNGAGKTTTINIICNLLKADSGLIEINQQPISFATKKLLGVAPQKNLLYYNLTCEENLRFYGQIYGLNHKQILKQTEYSLAVVNLLDRAKCLVKTLSGGMQRRLNIAAALVHQPKLLILDEPTTGLDIEARYDIWNLIENLRDQGITILLTSHLLDEVQRLCQKIAILKKGKVIAEGSLNELRAKIPAQEVVIIETTQETAAIALASFKGITHRRYGKDLAFWLREPLELTKIISLFEGIPLDSISRQAVQLEHIYIELMQD